MLNGLIFGGRWAARHAVFLLAELVRSLPTCLDPKPTPRPCSEAGSLSSTPFRTRSVLLLDYGFKPALHLGLSAVVGPASAAAISGALVGLYHVLWLFPAYLISFLVNCIW